jgi:hypothetical protein
MQTGESAEVLNALGIEGESNMTKTLEQRFDAAMMDIYRRAKTEAHYNASPYFQMLSEHRGVETARILLHADTVSEGYTALWERGRLDLTVEALIHDHPEYQALFTPEEGEIAFQRLKKYEYAATLDPVEKFIGAFPSEVANWVDEHDKHLGQAQADQLGGKSTKGS